MGGFCYLSLFSSNTTRSPSGRLAARNLERNARKYPAAYPGTERGGAQTRDKIMRKTEIISKSLMLSPRAEAEGFSSRTARSAPQMKTPPHECGGTNQYDVSRGIPSASTFLPTLLSYHAAFAFARQILVYCTMSGTYAACRSHTLGLSKSASSRRACPRITLGYGRATQGRPYYIMSSKTSQARNKMIFVFLCQRNTLGQ